MWILFSVAAESRRHEGEEYFSAISLRRFHAIPREWFKSSIYCFSLIVHVMILKWFRCIKTAVIYGRLGCGSLTADCLATGSFVILLQGQQCLTLGQLGSFFGKGFFGVTLATTEVIPGTGLFFAAVGVSTARPTSPGFFFSAGFWQLAIATTHVSKITIRKSITRQFDLGFY